MSSKWIKDIEALEFLEWAKKNPEDFCYIFKEAGWLVDVEEAEGEDFFGTEGFDKRFGG